MAPMPTPELIHTTYFQTRPLPVRPRSQGVARSGPSPRRRRSTVAWIADELPKLGFKETPLDDFYDVATKDTGMFRRFESTSEGLRLWFQDRHETVHTPHVSLLVSETGHYVLGITLEHRFDTSATAGSDRPDRGLFRELAILSMEQYEDTPQQGSWHLELPSRRRQNHDEAPLVCPASIRRAFDLLGFALHEALLGRTDTARMPERWSQSWADAEKRSHEMHQAGEVASPYLATWGYHTEVRDADPSAGIAETMLAARGITEDDVATPISTDAVRWLIGDFESIHLTAPHPGTDNAAIDHFNSRGLVEYLAFRRGVVTLIQRDILRCSINAAAIKREQVADWGWNLATTTDDYVLAGWNVGLLRRVRAASRSQLGIWDLGHREELVYQHLDGHRQQFQAEQGKLSTTLTLIFGAIAYASLLPVVSFVLAWLFDTPNVNDAPLERPVEFTVVNLVLLGLLLILSSRFVRRAGKLRSPNRNNRA